MMDWERVIARMDGPLHFRLILQPLMASLFAVWDGIKDARLGNPPYLWTLLTEPEQRDNLLKNGWKRVSKIYILALVLDVIYQLKVSGWIYPGETLLVVFGLAIAPYLLLRGPVNRALQMRRNKTT
jgi:hypothetical protein